MMDNEVQERVKNEVAKYYDSVSTAYDNGLYTSLVCRAEDRVITKILDENVRGEVLDLGCGTGLFLEMVQPLKYTGVDLSTGMIEEARKKFPERNFEIADMYQYVSKLPPESIDTIVSLFGPMSYSMTPLDLIKECKRVLKPGGKILMMPYTRRVGKCLNLPRKVVFENDLPKVFYTTALDNDIPKLFYTSDMVLDLFACFKNLKVIGLNYFADTVFEMSGELGHNHEIDDLEKFLLNEIETIALPVEYARHCLVIGQN